MVWCVVLVVTQFPRLRRSFFGVLSKLAGPVVTPHPFSRGSANHFTRSITYFHNYFFKRLGYLTKSRKNEAPWPNTLVLRLVTNAVGTTSATACGLGYTLER